MEHFRPLGIMALTVIGGAGPLGRSILRALGGHYTDLRLGDMYPFRPAVYRLQEQLAPQSLTKHALSHPTSLKLALTGAAHAIIVTHDYYKLAHSKNFFVEKAAFMAKELGVKRLTLVYPLGYDQLNPADGEPEKLRKASEERAKTLMPELSILRTNLVFGGDGADHAISIALQMLYESKSPAFPNEGKAKFQPVHEDDVISTLQSLQPKEDVTLSGPETLSWGEICSVLRAHVGRKDANLGGGLEGLKTMLAQSTWVGDLLYPSHVQQLYWLLAQDRLPVPTKTGTKKFAETYAAEAYKGASEKFWWRVIAD